MLVFGNPAVSFTNFLRIAVLITLVCILVIGTAVAQSGGKVTPTGSSPDGEWKGVPKDFPVTRWPEESEIRPTGYAHWKAQQEPSGLLQTESITFRNPIKGAHERGFFAIIVNSDLRSNIQASLDQYMVDLAVDGYEVELISASGGTPEEFRSFLYDKYQEGLQGAVLIGDLPIAWYEISCWEPIEHEEFPCDLYYMDLDGIWEDTDGEGMYDSHSGEVDPEIWVGRLTASPMNIYGADEATLLNNYFRKNHLYRIGQLPLAARALLYIDDDWEGSSFSWGKAVSSAYPDPTVISDPYETVDSDYENRLPQNHELIQVCAHSDPLAHYFSTPVGDGGATSVGTVVGIDPQAVFYNLFACSNSRFIENDYMGGWYIFCQTFGLASIGSTKTGSMLYFDAFYEPFGLGSTFGEAFTAWFSEILWGGQSSSDICWFYGMTLCGDPTLRSGLSSSPEMVAYDLYDISGDGDRVLEAGETVECRFAFTNLGAATASGLSIELSINDASINIIDDYALIGDIGPGSYATNDSDPLEFEIPIDYLPRTDTLYISIAWNEGTCFDTVAIGQAIGGARILMVDDDDKAAIENYYREYLDHCFIPYHEWDAADSTVTSGDLTAYETVVWFTGGYRADLLTSAEISAIAAYLDSGGNLFLSGQGIAEQLSGADPDFLHNYLRSDYLSTGYVPILTDVPGGLVFDYADSLCIIGAGGQSYQTNADQIDTINGGIAELEYLTGIGPGAVSFEGSYRTIFFSFGFETILTGNSRWADRDSLYSDILDFFDYTRPAAYPLAFDLTVSPGDPMWMLDHTPDISWSYFDPESNPQEMYHVQVGSDDFWGTAEMWDYGPIPGTGTLVTYGGTYLECGQRYYIRVRVFNGSMWSNWVSTPIQMNGVPVATGLSPTNMEAVEDTIPDLTHDNMVDPEGSPLTYSYELYDDESLTVLLAHADDQPAGVGATMSWTVPLVLSHNEDYYWRVCTSDTIETGRWSYAAGFVVFPEIANMCGDANGDDQVNIGDAVFLIAYVFLGGPAPAPVCMGDANGDGDLNIGDPVYLITYVFGGGPEPVETCCP
jgi:hypothetical protein